MLVIGLVLTYISALPAPQEYVLYQRATPAGSEALSLGGLFKAAKDGYNIAKDGIDAYHAGEDAWDSIKSSSTSSDTFSKKSSKTSKEVHEEILEEILKEILKEIQRVSRHML